jgi:hypothetical protein
LIVWNRVFHVPGLARNISLLICWSINLGAPLGFYPLSTGGLSTGIKMSDPEADSLYLSKAVELSTPRISLHDVAHRHKKKRFSISEKREWIQQDHNNVRIDHRSITDSFGILSNLVRDLLGFCGWVYSTKTVNFWYCLRTLCFVGTKTEVICIKHAHLQEYSSALHNWWGPSQLHSGNGAAVASVAVTLHNILYCNSVADFLANTNTHPNRKVGITASNLSSRYRAILPCCECLPMCFLFKFSTWV